jgi:hypothetical protein
MNKILICLTVLLATNAFADVSGEYIKKNGIADVNQQGKAVEFSINSSVGQNVCNVEGTAVMIDANRAIYTPEEKSNKCVVVLNFKGGVLKVTTKDCDEYCGLNAAGSMDGSYQKKTSKKVGKNRQLITSEQHPKYWIPIGVPMFETAEIAQYQLNAVFKRGEGICEVDDSEKTCPTFQDLIKKNLAAKTKEELVGEEIGRADWSFSLGTAEISNIPAYTKHYPIIKVRLKSKNNAEVWIVEGHMKKMEKPSEGHMQQFNQ